jgi:hypothetical protein
MDQKKILKQMIEFSQATFNNAFTTIAMVQDQFEKVTKIATAQADWLPEEGRKAIEEWAEAYKTGRDQYKKAVDESYKKVEEYFSHS